MNNIPALVQIMAWCRPGDKPLFEPIVVTRPEWVNNDTEPPSNFCNKIYYRFSTMDIPFAKLETYENSFGKLSACSEIPCSIAPEDYSTPLLFPALIIAFCSLGGVSKMVEWINRIDGMDDNYTIIKLCDVIHNPCHKFKALYTWWYHETQTFFRATGPLWGESTGHRRIPFTQDQ